MDFENATDEALLEALNLADTDDLRKPIFEEYQRRLKESKGAVEEQLLAQKELEKQNDELKRAKIKELLNSGTPVEKDPDDIDMKSLLHDFYNVEDTTIDLKEL